MMLSGGWAWESLALTFSLPCSFQKWFYAKVFSLNITTELPPATSDPSAGLHKTAILNRDENINDLGRSKVPAPVKSTKTLKRQPYVPHFGGWSYLWPILKSKIDKNRRGSIEIDKKSKKSTKNWHLHYMKKVRKCLGTSLKFKKTDLKWTNSSKITCSWPKDGTKKLARKGLKYCNVYSPDETTYF